MKFKVGDRHLWHEAGGLDHPTVEIAGSGPTAYLYIGGSGPEGVCYVTVDSENLVRALRRAGVIPAKQRGNDKRIAQKLDALWCIDALVDELKAQVASMASAIAKLKKVGS